VCRPLPGTGIEMLAVHKRRTEPGERSSLSQLCSGGPTALRATRGLHPPSPPACCVCRTGRTMFHGTLALFLHPPATLPRPLLGSCRLTASSIPTWAERRPRCVLLSPAQRCRAHSQCHQSFCASATSSRLVPWLRAGNRSVAFFCLLQYFV
jgi:hypothetical protein